MEGSSAFTKIRQSRQRRFTRQRASARRHFRNGQRTAVVRAMTAAALYLGKPVVAHTLADAAEKCGSGIRYVEAAVTLLRTNDEALIATALAGDRSLLEIATEVRRRANLVTAYRKASAADKIALAKAVGPSVLWDDVLAPVL
jgi:hypothetical protein